MQIIGDIDRTRIYTLSELEKKERLESVLATECDMFNVLSIDPKDKDLQREYMYKYSRKDLKIQSHKKKCKCTIRSFKQVKYISLRELVTYNSGKCDLVGVDMGYIIPRNSALGREFRNLLVLIRQIAISSKGTESTSIDFFALWLAVSIGIVIVLYIERVFGGEKEGYIS